MTAPGKRAARPIVAIDGPAGAGKSTVARAVARALGYAHLDTGAMYRAVTARVLDEGVDPGDERAVSAIARASVFRLGPKGLTLDGRALGSRIRGRRVARSVSAVSATPGVRRALVKTQRAILDRGRVVAEGRDIGTVVAPRAPLKIFLTASIDERARRRHAEMAKGADPVSLAALKREIARRDRADSTRAVSPLRPAKDAVIIDTTGRTPRSVVNEIVDLARPAAGKKSRR